MYLQYWRKICMEGRTETRQDFRQDTFPINSEHCGPWVPNRHNRPGSTTFTNSCTSGLIEVLTIKPVASVFRLRPEDGSRRFLSNDYKFLRECTASNPQNTNMCVTYVFGTLLSILRHQTGEGNDRHGRWIRLWMLGYTQTHVRGQKNISRGMKIVNASVNKNICNKSLLAWRQ